MEEIVSTRASLVTKFLLKCKQPNRLLSSDNGGFHTFTKQGQVNEINRRATLAYTIIGKGFSKHTKYWEQLSKELCTEIMKMTVESAKKLVQEDK